MKFQRKPLIVDAEQWTGTIESIAKISRLSDMHTSKLMFIKEDDTVVIRSQHGTLVATLGDWIIKNVNGNLYPCGKATFNLTYEPVDPDIQPLTPFNRR